MSMGRREGEEERKEKGRREERQRKEERGKKGERKKEKGREEGRDRWKKRGERRDEKGRRIERLSIHRLAVGAGPVPDPRKEAESALHQARSHAGKHMSVCLSVCVLHKGS